MDVKDITRDEGGASSTDRETRDMGEAVRREAEDAKARLGGAAQEIREGAREAPAAVAGLVSEQVERRKGEAAGALRDVAAAMRRAADELGRDAAGAGLAREAAHGVERLSRGLESRSAPEMMRALSSYGRENPATFIFGCLLAGAAAGRFLMASGARAERDAWSDEERCAAYAGGVGRAGYAGGGAASAAGGYADAGRADPEAGMAGGAGVYTTPGATPWATSGVDATRQAGGFAGDAGVSSAGGDVGDLDPLGTRADADADRAWPHPVDPAGVRDDAPGAGDPTGAAALDDPTGGRDGQR